jgi:hypothetical protein
MQIGKQSEKNYARFRGNKAELYTVILYDKQTLMKLEPVTTY